MGWCSATEIFDSVCGALLDAESSPIRETIVTLVKTLEAGDWDCQSDSEYYDHPMVQSVMRELHPGWYDDEESEEDYDKEKDSLLALLDELLVNGNNSKDALYAWFLGERDLIDEIVNGAE